MDIIKCADIICPVLSCRSTNIQGMQLDPHEKGGAFDEIGYTVLNMIRSMGTPTTIGVVQDLNLH
jgi:pyruvate dehydrogenase E1 component beta subunit/pre-rRNA-processing protein TSR1